MSDPVAYLYENEDGSKELILDCNGEYARRLLEQGYTEMPLFATPEPTDPAGVSGLADELERDTDWTFAEAGCWLALNRAAILAALRTPPVLEVAKEALVDIARNANPENREAQWRIATARAALQTIGAGQ